ncbi:MAG: protein-L-isoaspartate O-methyltransferase [Candidatus Competibacterales bacterium]|nr:protein-L-isoaspartate O-methyltransferase [Candidatus Competibacterales bacterium]
MTAIDFEQARFNMIEQQIRPWDVLDQRVLDTLAGVPREDFVPERYRRLAFADVRIPLGHGQVMMNPNVEGRLLQALTIRPTDSILEVGTGSGFLTACLARLGHEVDSVEIRPEFTERARTLLQRHGITSAHLYTDDAARDWGGRLYDVIALTGALPELPDSWRRRLTVGGRLFAVVGEPPIMEARLVLRVGQQEWEQESLFETELPYLLNCERPAHFEF